LRLRVATIAGAAALIALSALADADAGASKATPGKKTQTVTLSATSEEWTDTGIELGKGQQATITVSGEGTCHEGGAADCPGGPVGAGYLCSENPALGPLPPGPAGEAVPYGAVAGKLGEGAPFEVGAGKTVKGPGELYLLYNDCDGYYGDNAGSFEATIEYEAVVLSGKVTRECFKSCSTNGKGIAGVKLTAKDGEGGEATAKTDAEGSYELELEHAGSWTVKPSKREFAFDPKDRTVDVTGSKPGVDFTGCGPEEDTPASAASVDARTADEKIKPGEYQSSGVITTDSTKACATLRIFATVQAGGNVSLEVRVEPLNELRFTIQCKKPKEVKGDLYVFDINTASVDGFAYLKATGKDDEPLALTVLKAERHKTKTETTEYLYTSKEQGEVPLKGASKSPPAS
jgi:hypothetical protein